MHKVLVTCAGQRPGLQLMELLSEQGHPVRALVGPHCPIPPEAAQRCAGDVRICDLGECQAAKEDVAACFAGVKWVFHTTPVLPPALGTPALRLEASLALTERVLSLAQAAGVQRVVLTSTAATVGASRTPASMRGADDWDRSPAHPEHFIALRVEQFALRRAAELGVDLVVLCPTVMAGPLDGANDSEVALAHRLFSGQWALPPGGTNVVDVRDVAQAHLAAATRGEPGARYLIGGDNLGAASYADHIEKVGGTPVPLVDVPTWTLRQAGQLPGPALGHRLPLAPVTLAQAVVAPYAWFDDAPMRKVLGVRTRSSEKALAETHAWLQRRRNAVA